MEFECARCGALFTQERMGRRRRYCLACSPRDGYRQRGPYELVCRTCGLPFTSPTSRAMFCSPLCKSRKDTSLTERSCSECGNAFVTVRGRFCSPECRVASRRRDAVVAREVIVARCEQCGRKFDYVKRNDPRRRRFCSDACNRAAHRADLNHRRRSATRSGERFTTLEIAERDGWRCHLCGRRVSRKNWSIDHLIPLSERGEHLRSNVALAHANCNTVRNVGGAAQLRLVG